MDGYDPPGGAPGSDGIRKPVAASATSEVGLGLTPSFEPDCGLAGAAGASGSRAGDSEQFGPGQGRGAGGGSSARPRIAGPRTTYSPHPAVATHGDSTTAAATMAARQLRNRCDKRGRIVTGTRT